MAADPVGIAATNEIIKVLGSTLDSPSKEVGNYIADKIRYLRYKSLLSIVKNAEEKARKAGLDLKMPAIKFFVPFSEAASLENDIDSSDSLRGAWSNLLITASQEEDARHLLFLRILKEITAKELGYISRMINEGRGGDGIKPGGWFHREDAPLFDRDSVYAFIRGLQPDDNGQDLANSIVEGLENSGLLFHVVVICVGKPYVDMAEIATIYDSKDYYRYEGTVEVLSSLGVVRKFRFDDIEFEKDPSYSVRVEGVVITKLGVDFYDMCSRSELPG